MIELIGQPFRCCDGVSRRNFLRAGWLGFAGLGLGDVLRAKAEARTSGQPGRATSR